MAIKDSISAAPLATLASASLTGTYQPINPLGLPDPAFLVKIHNFGTTIITISLDGTNDHEVVNLATTGEVYGGEGSSQPSNQNCLWPKGQIFYAKGVAGTGSVYLSAYFQTRVSP